MTTLAERAQTAYELEQSRSEEKRRQFRERKEVEALAYAELLLEDLGADPRVSSYSTEFIEEDIGEASRTILTFKKDSLTFNVDSFGIRSVVLTCPECSTTYEKTLDPKPFALTSLGRALVTPHECQNLRHEPEPNFGPLTAKQEAVLNAVRATNQHLSEIIKGA